MADTAIARRYAKAFIELAQERQIVDQLGNELTKTITALQSGDGALFDALANPVFTLDERKAVLAAVLPRLRPHALIQNLLSLMLDKRRFDALPDVIEAYLEMADESAGRVRVTVETAEPMSAQLTGEVVAALEGVTGKKVNLETAVQPELIGGIVARVGSRVYDASIRTRLETVKQALLNTQMAAEA